MGSQCDFHMSYYGCRKTSPIQNGVKKALELTGEVKRCLNLGSYNYLGFAAADDYCTARVRGSAPCALLL